MSLSIGELVGYLRIEDETGRGIDSAEARIRAFGGTAESAMADTEQRLGASGRRAGEAAGTGIAAGAGEGTERAGAEVQTRAEKWSGRLAAAGGAAGAALGGALAGAMAGAVEFDAAQAKLEAQLSATTPFAAEAGEIAGRLYANAYGENIGEVNEAVKSMLQSGVVLADDSAGQVEALTGKAMSLAQAFDQDVSAGVNAAGQMLKTGLADNADEAFDILAAGFQAGNDKAGDLLDTFNEYGTQFRKLGVDGATAMGLIQQGLQGGARDADLVADAMKEFSIRAVDGSKGAAEAYKALGLDAATMTAQIAKGGADGAAGLDIVLDRLRGMEDPVARNAAAVGLFGTQAEDLGAALFKIDPSTAVAGLGQVADAATRLDATIGDTAAAKVEKLTRGYEQWSASLIATDGPMGAVAAGVTAFGPAAIGMAGSLAMIGMALGPLIVKLWVAGAAAATTAASWLASMITMAVGTALHVGSMLVQMAIWVARTVAQGAVAVASMIVTAASYVASWLVMAAGAMVQAAIMAASWLIAMGPVGWVIALIVGLVALIIANWDTVVAWTTQAWGAVSAFITDVWNNIVGFVSGVVAAVVGFVTDAWNNVSSATSGAWDAVLGFISDAWNNITGFVSGAISNVVGFLTDGWNNAVRFAGDAWNNIVNAVSAGITGVINFVTGLPGQILGALGNLGSLLFNAGRDVITGLWNGISGMGGWLFDQIMGFIKWAVPGPILQFLGIASPSKYMRDQIGRHIPEGLADGILGNARVAGDAARAMAAQVATSAQRGVDGALGSTGFGSAGLGPLGGSLGARGGDGAAMPTTVTKTVHTVINNPLPERSSDSIGRAGSVLAALGPWGDQ